MTTGIAFIISNVPGRRHRAIFENLCNKSIAMARKNCKDMPIAVLVRGGKTTVKADHVIDGSDYADHYDKMNKNETHGLIIAELLKTHIAEWSPFDSTIYLDCDAFIMRRIVKHYVEVLDLGYELSLTTCASMAWKDDISNTNVRHGVFDGAPTYFPYWNFGVFGSNRKSTKLLEKIREEYLTYCFKGDSQFRSTPHAQPAVVRAAHAFSPDHRIFTMPAAYNCHISGAGGNAFWGIPVVLHMWKDIRDIIIKEEVK